MKRGDHAEALPHQGLEQIGPILVKNEHRPSGPDLLDTIYLYQQRQEWYRDFARSMGEPPLTRWG